METMQGFCIVILHEIINLPDFSFIMEFGFNYGIFYGNRNEIESSNKKPLVASNNERSRWAPNNKRSRGATTTARTRGASQAARTRGASQIARTRGASEQNEENWTRTAAKNRSSNPRMAYGNCGLIFS